MTRRSSLKFSLQVLLCGGRCCTWGSVVGASPTAGGMAFAFAIVWPQKLPISLNLKSLLIAWQFFFQWVLKFSLTSK